MTRRLVAICLFLAFTGCSDSPTAPEPLDIGGTWRFSFNNMNGPYQGTTVSCNGASFDFALTQSGETFSGVQVGFGSLSCSANGQTLLSESVSGETLVSGRIDGSTITFRLGTIDGLHRGTVSSTSMSGTAEWVVQSGNASLSLSGQFNAAKL